jgi:hypothetical protein
MLRVFWLKIIRFKQLPLRGQAGVVLNMPSFVTNALPISCSQIYFRTRVIRCKMEVQNNALKLSENCRSKGMRYRQILLSFKNITNTTQAHKHFKIIGYKNYLIAFK